MTKEEIELLHFNWKGFKNDSTTFLASAKILEELCKLALDGLRWRDLQTLETMNQKLEKIRDFNIAMMTHPIKD